MFQGVESRQQRAIDSKDPKIAATRVRLYLAHRVVVGGKIERLLEDLMMCMSVHSSSASSFCSTRETIAERISSFARQEIIPSIMRTSKACKRILPVSVKRLTLFYHLPFLTPRSSFATAMQSFSSSTLSHHLKSIAQNRNEDAFLLLDGGTGEELFRRKVPDERMIWSATAVLKSEYHEVLEQVHASFLQAGAQAITTNSYGIVPGVGFDDAEERGKWIRLAGKIARKAVEKHKSSSPAYVLGSLGPLVESYRADLIRPHDQGVNEYGVACQALQPHCDAFLAETMSCWEESRQALEAVSLLPRDQRLPVMVSYTLDSKGNTRDGKPVTDCVQNLLDYIIEQNLDCKFKMLF